MRHPRVDGRRAPRGSAFTLIEVLVVVAIIALLIAILLPSLSKARTRARSAVCLSNLRSIGSASTMYMGDNRDWLPVGPPDKTFWLWYTYELKNGIQVRVPHYSSEPVPGAAKIIPWSNCHWGGKRAELIHTYPNMGLEPTPETYTRPLTRYIHPKSRLDNDMPVFHCPGDRELSDTARRKFEHYWEVTLPDNKSIYDLCGNSYYSNPWYGSPFGKKRHALVTSQVVLYEDGIFELDKRSISALNEDTKKWEVIVPSGPSLGWHGSFSKYNMLFLDFHAASMYADPLKLKGPGWVIENYFDIMDYYY
jgi:prepilin-type N-terminal cleavage/methylation domain-containing protein